MLVKNPIDRISLQDALKHSWFSKAYKCNDLKIYKDTLDRLTQ